MLAQIWCQHENCCMVRCIPAVEVYTEKVDSQQDWFTQRYCSILSYQLVQAVTLVGDSYCLLKSPCYSVGQSFNFKHFSYIQHDITQHQEWLYTTSHAFVAAQ